jgi:hypothetical protein
VIIPDPNGIVLQLQQASKPATGAVPDPNKTSTLREQALADASVQALLEVFPAEIRDVEGCNGVPGEGGARYRVPSAWYRAGC